MANLSVPVGGKQDVGRTKPSRGLWCFLQSRSLTISPSFCRCRDARQCNVSNRSQLLTRLSILPSILHRLMRLIQIAPWDRNFLHLPRADCAIIDHDCEDKGRMYLVSICTLPRQARDCKKEHLPSAPVVWYVLCIQSLHNSGWTASHPLRILQHMERQMKVMMNGRGARFCLRPPSLGLRNDMRKANIPIAR